MTNAEARYMGLIAQLACVVCRHALGVVTPMVELHHIAEGSSVRSSFAMAPLCVEHHRGKTGLHGMGTRAFCAAYRVPWEKEEGLMVWTNEDLIKNVPRLI